MCGSFPLGCSQAPADALQHHLGSHIVPGWWSRDQDSWEISFQEVYTTMLSLRKMNSWFWKVSSPLEGDPVKAATGLLPSQKVGPSPRGPPCSGEGPSVWLSALSSPFFKLLRIFFNQRSHIILLHQSYRNGRTQPLFLSLRACMKGREGQSSRENSETFLTLWEAKNREREIHLGKE